jgi:hypothetical protein
MLSLYETAVINIMKSAAEYHRITVDELRKRIVAGEPLIHQYHVRNGEINF